MQNKTDPLHTAHITDIDGSRPLPADTVARRRQNHQHGRVSIREGQESDRICVAVSLFVLLLAMLLLILFAPHLSAAQSSPGSAAVETVKAVTGNGGGGDQGKDDSSSNSTKHPYKNRETPESLEGWADYLIYLPLYKTGGEWIRLHNLLFALVLLIGGIWLSVLSGRVLKKALMHFKGLPEHIAIAFSKGLVYLLFLLTLLATVLVAGMPFSFVSFLGAMILIGASLGAKSTIYDYLSGMVLAIEQPIRIRDCVELGDQSGFVDEIRGRYTRVRRFDGIDVLVPNSKFLEEEVVNWTLSDSRLRGEYTIGVHYSSDIDRTMDILIECMEENDEVLDDPKPSVLFWEFGDNALVFKLFFWTMAHNPLEIWSVESKLRRQSFKRLKESGITVAFPQRDVHLDTSAPLKVAVESRPANGEESKEETGGLPEQTASASSEQRREERQDVAEPESSSKEEEEEKVQ